MTPAPLPVPGLDETLGRFLRAASAIVDEETLERSRRAAEEFRRGRGVELQEALEVFARREDDAGRSWLSEAWLAAYMEDRGPLTLGGNVSFQLNIGSETCGVERAAEIVHRAAVVHLEQAAGRTVPEVDARGTELSREQWAALNGGVRHPRAGRDVFLSCELGAARREIGVLHRGRLHVLAISDDAGLPPGPRLLADGLRRVLAVGAAPAPSEPDAAGEGPGESAAAAVDPDPVGVTEEPDPAAATEEPGMGFADLSYLGSGELAAPLERILSDPSNARTYQRLADLLFTVSLEDGAAAASEHLRALAFDPGRVWAAKPISYEVGLRDDWACLHAEHSTIDGATLVELVRRMQEVELPGPDDDAASSAGLASPSDVVQPVDADLPDGVVLLPGATQPAEPAELLWRLDPAIRRELRRSLEEYRRRAHRLRVELVRVPRVPQERLPFPMSADALQQLVMVLAQLLAFGRLRSVYESVDMRAFQAGRTECLRPVTPEAASFARALLEGRAGREDLVAALEAHRGWIKACKTGRGVDRHLGGLEATSRRLDVEDPFFDDEALALLRADFLSTTSLGTCAQIIRYAFAPSVPGGFGVSYTQYPECFEYCVTYDAEEAERPGPFMEGLAEGGPAAPGVPGGAGGGGRFGPWVTRPGRKPGADGRGGPCRGSRSSAPRRRDVPDELVDPLHGFLEDGQHVEAF
ncbi:choline/carnitine O-acyltransferase [Rothia halotolerans]|uniref:choline/carnitine O-acyltransferase n=1 Tax=Rothia halotolerans TaxID=405770 RepID=UPI00101D8FC3|nr:choline/carnitine O-acyltransferase [Rothia halotolerans]